MIEGLEQRADLTKVTNYGREWCAPGTVTRLSLGVNLGRNWFNFVLMESQRNGANGT